jgi:hypothetical protein
MRIRVIACEVLARPLYLLAANSPHIVDIELMPKGLHNEPDRLRAALQGRIDAPAQFTYDAVALGYALCSNATAGLVARDVPVVLPRGHDCITLYLGSRNAYEREFSEHPGTYYYTKDYWERSNDDGVALGAVTDAAIRQQYEEYVRKYGKDNADYLIEVLGAWRQNYRRAAFIAMGIGDESLAERAAQEEAARNNWEYARLAGSLQLLRKLVDGEWDEDFLIVPPEHAVRVTYREDIVEASRPAGGHTARPKMPGND